MLIRRIVISPGVMEKIRFKHRLEPSVAKDVLSDTPYIEKVGGGQYMAIGVSYLGYVTIFFKYRSGTAEITTAYPSKNWQMDLYKKKKKR
jgi:hypothetical protein